MLARYLGSPLYFAYADVLYGFLNSSAHIHPCFEPIAAVEDQLSYLQRCGALRGCRTYFSRKHMTLDFDASAEASSFSDPPCLPTFNASLMVSVFVFYFVIFCCQACYFCSFSFLIGLTGSVHFPFYRGGIILPFN